MKRVRANLKEPLIEGIESLVEIIKESHYMNELQQWGFDNGIDMDNDGVINFEGLDVAMLQEIYTGLEEIAYRNSVERVESSFRKPSRRNASGWQSKGFYISNKEVGEIAKRYDKDIIATTNGLSRLYLMALSRDVLQGAISYIQKEGIVFESIGKIRYFMNKDTWGGIYEGKRVYSVQLDIDADKSVRSPISASKSIGRRANKITESRKQKMVQEVKKAADDYFAELGFEKGDVPIVVEFYDNCLEVRVDAIDYDDQFELADKLSKVVRKYDKEAYFDLENFGVLQAYFFDGGVGGNKNSRNADSNIERITRRAAMNGSKEYIAFNRSGNVEEDNFRSLEDAVDYAMDNPKVVSIREGNIGRQGKEVWRKRTGYVGASRKNILREVRAERKGDMMRARNKRTNEYYSQADFDKLTRELLAIEDVEWIEYDTTSFINGEEDAFQRKLIVLVGNGVESTLDFEKYFDRLDKLFSSLNKVFRDNGLRQADPMEDNDSYFYFVLSKVGGKPRASRHNASRVKASMTAESAANYFTQYANYMDDAAAMEFLLPAFEKIQAEVDIDWGNISDSINQVIYDNLNEIAENPSVLAFMEDSDWEEEALHEYLSEEMDFIISDYDSFLDMLDIPEEMQRNSYLLKGVYDDVRDDDAFYEINGYANGFDEVDLDDYKDDEDNEDWDSLDDWDKVERIRDAGYEVDTGDGWWEWANEVGGDDWETKLQNLQDLNEAERESFDGLLYFDNSVGRYEHPKDIRDWYLAEALEWKINENL